MQWDWMRKNDPSFVFRVLSLVEQQESKKSLDFQERCVLFFFPFPASDGHVYVEQMAGLFPGQGSHFMFLDNLYVHSMR